MKRKSKSVEADGAKALPAARKIERTRIEVAAHQLRPAPWNPRPEITSESVADITASIREIGLIQPIVVMRDPLKRPYANVDFFLVVAGHRRFKACVDAGLSPIPCDVIDCDEATAKRITMIENLQRRDVDPLMEADLIAQLIDGGMTQAEIAAETGRGAKWVARRANLVKLSKSWRKRVADGERMTVDCMEHIAAYPEEIQEKLKDVSGYAASYDAGGMLTWGGVKWQFQRESRELRDVMFDTAMCLNCVSNTGCCPDLFDDDGGSSKLGRCLNAKCFASATEEAINDAIAKAEKRGRTIVRGKRSYQCGIYGTTKKPTKINTALYVYKDCDGKMALEYAAPPPPKDEEAERKAKEGRLAAKEDAKRLRLIETAREEASEKFEGWISATAAVGIWPKWFIDCAIDRLCREVEEGYGGDPVDAFARNTGFAASDPAANAVYQEFLTREGSAS